MKKSEMFCCASFRIMWYQAQRLFIILNTNTYMKKKSLYYRAERMLTRLEKHIDEITDSKM